MAVANSSSICSLTHGHTLSVDPSPGATITACHGAGTPGPYAYVPGPRRARRARGCSARAHPYRVASANIQRALPIAHAVPVIDRHYAQICRWN